MVDSEEIVPIKKSEKNNAKLGKKPKVLAGTHEKIVDRVF